MDNSNEEGTAAHRDVEEMFKRWRAGSTNEQLAAYVNGMMRLDPDPVPECRNDPRPRKGKFEPQHLFNSRLRDWNRRNP